MHAVGFVFRFGIVRVVFLSLWCVGGLFGKLVVSGEGWDFDEVAY